MSSGNDSRTSVFRKKPFQRLAVLHLGHHLLVSGTSCKHQKPVERIVRTKTPATWYPYFFYKDPKG